MAQSEVIHIGSLKSSTECPFQENGLKWNLKTFKALGVMFSLETKSLYEFNFPMELKKMEQVVKLLETEEFIIDWEDSSCKISLIAPTYVFILCFMHICP